MGSNALSINCNMFTIKWSEVWTCFFLPVTRNQMMWGVKVYPLWPSTPSTTRNDVTKIRREFIVGKLKSVNLSRKSNVVQPRGMFCHMCIVVTVIRWNQALRLHGLKYNTKQCYTWRRGRKTQHESNTSSFSFPLVPQARFQSAKQVLRSLSAESAQLVRTR